jgi:hypothetical protein
VTGHRLKHRKAQKSEGKKCLFFQKFHHFRNKDCCSKSEMVVSGSDGGTQKKLKE